MVRKHLSTFGQKLFALPGDPDNRDPGYCGTTEI